MKMPDTWKSLWNNDDFIANLTSLVKTINGIASVALLALVIYLPYQAILAVVSWF
jgi:hypothetical protein